MAIYDDLGKMPVGNWAIGGNAMGADWTAIAGMLTGTVIVAIIFIGRAINKRGTGRRELHRR
jgi:hypothetical protein